MQNYELLCVLPGTIAEDAVGSHVESVEKVLEGQGAKITNKNEMGKSRLAYPMKHIRYGYYVEFIFEAEKSAIEPIESKLRVMPELLRALIQVFDASKMEAYNTRMEELAAKKEKKTIEEVAKKDIKAPKAKESAEVEGVEANEANSSEENKEIEEDSSKSDQDKDKETKPVEDIDKKLDELLDKPMDTE